MSMKSKALVAVPLIVAMGAGVGIGFAIGDSDPASPSPVATVTATPFPMATTFSCSTTYKDRQGQGLSFPGPLGQGYRSFRFEWPGPDGNRVSGSIACAMNEAPKPPFPKHWERQADGGVIDRRTGEEIPPGDPRLAPWDDPQ